MQTLHEREREDKREGEESNPSGEAKKIFDDDLLQSMPKKEKKKNENGKENLEGVTKCIGSGESAKKRGVSWGGLVSIRRRCETRDEN